MAGKMKAWVFREAGNPAEVLKVETDYPRPIPKGKQILIKVSAGALNPVGWKSMSKPPLSIVHKKPAVPESDFSGVVAGGNLDGTGFELGQEVFGITPADSVMLSGVGTLAEYTLAQPNVVARKPSNISHAEAASFPLAGLTAYFALIRNGGLKQGDGKRVFINGGSGGVGVWGVQIAKAYGAYVVATSSPESDALVKSLGADETIDYRSASPSLAAHLAATYPITASKGFDLVFDTVGTPVLYDASPDYLVKDGIYLDAAGAAHIDGISSALSTAGGLVKRLALPSFVGGTPRKYKLLLLPAGNMGAELKEAAGLLEARKIKAVVDHVYPFDDAMGAYERQISNRTKGKVVVSIA